MTSAWSKVLFSLRVSSILLSSTLTGIYVAGSEWGRVGGAPGDPRILVRRSLRATILFLIFSRSSGETKSRGLKPGAPCLVSLHLTLTWSGTRSTTSPVIIASPGSSQFISYAHSLLSPPLSMAIRTSLGSVSWWIIHVAERLRTVMSRSCGRWVSTIKFAPNFLPS